MNAECAARLAELRGPWCSQLLIRDLYGLEIERLGNLRRDFESWAAFHRRGEAILHEQVHRYLFETFLQNSRLLPRKWAAARVGMEEASLEQVLTCLRGRGLLWPAHSTLELVSEAIDTELISLFDEFRFRTFSSHNDFCSRLHTAIKDRLDLQVVPLHCVTSQAITDDPSKWDYSHEFDVVTLAPVGLRYKVWLNLGKPMNLRPDCCSTKFYAEERESLRDFLMGTQEPEIPDELLAIRG